MERKHGKTHTEAGTSASDQDLIQGSYLKAKETVIGYRVAKLQKSSL